MNVFSAQSHARHPDDPIRDAEGANSTEGSGIYLGHDARGWHRAEPQQSVLVLGPPRSGKTSSLVIPNILESGGPVVTTSTKPDVLDATMGTRAQVGRCHLFDPTASVDDRDGVHRVRWSPLPACTSWRTALATARSLVTVGAGTASAAPTGNHWSERAQALLAPLLHAAALDGHDMRTVLGWVDRHRALPAQQILSGPDTAVARDLLDGIVTTDERELSGIWSTTSGALGGFRSEEALAATCDPNFDPLDFVDSCDTVYIAAPAHHQALVAPLVVGLLDDVRRAAYARSASGLGEGKPPVLLALDELANIAPLPDLPSMISEGGGQGVVTLACFQDLSQARYRWPTQADGFPSLFGTTVVLPGIGDVRTLDALSVLAGDDELVTRSFSRGRTLSDRPMGDLLFGGRPQVGEQLSTQWRRRLAPDVITRGVPGCALTFDRRNQPSWIGLAPAHLTEPWRSLTGTGRAVDRALDRRVGSTGGRRRGVEDGVGRTPGAGLGR
jgi:type IV secretory pathway TraG/TraD family ATPase VirD4